MTEHIIEHSLVEKISDFYKAQKFKYQLNHFKRIDDVTKLDELIEYKIDNGKIDDALRVAEYFLFERQEFGHGNPNYGYMLFLYSECLFRDKRKDEDNQRIFNYAKMYLEKSLNLIERQNRDQGVENEPNDFIYVMRRILADELFHQIIAIPKTDKGFLMQIKRIYDGSIKASYEKGSYQEYVKSLASKIKKDDTETIARITQLSVWANTFLTAPKS